MSKYWLFLENQVTGPYEPDELRALSGFNSESLICPEGRKGTDMGDWQRAAIVPELASSAVKTIEVLAVQDAAESVSDAEPFQSKTTNLQSESRFSSLEMALGGVHEQMRRNEEDLLNLHKIIDDERNGINGWIRDLNAKISRIEEKFESSLENSSRDIGAMKQEMNERRSEIASKIQEMGKSISALASLRQDLDVLSAKQKETESLSKSQAENAEGASRRIQELQSEIGLLRDRSFGIPASPGAVPPQAEHAPKQQEGLPTPPQMETAPASAGPTEFSQGAVFEPLSGVLPAGEFSSMPAFSGDSGSSAPANESAFGGSPQESVAGAQLIASAASAQINPAVEIGITAPNPPVKSKKGKAFMWVGFVLLAGGVLLAFEEGLIPMGGKSAQPVPKSPVQIPAALPSQTQAELAEKGFKKEALQLVQTWPLASAKTIGLTLATASSKGGNLSPWMVEKVSDGVYQVNFYGSQVQSGPLQSYQFEARLDDRQVIGLNDLARNLLNPPPLPIKVMRHPRKAHARAKKTIRIRKKHAAKKTTKPVLPGLEKPAGSAKKTGSSSSAQDAQLLDNLLKP
ncbi:MAG: DUF4339 domain-containing protein [Elusimicrobiota bacterium]